MSISKDPDQMPIFPPKMGKTARAEGMHLVLITCREENEEGEMREGLRYWAIMAFLPRIGETILLEDGNRCEVKEIVHGTITKLEGYPMMCANVFGDLIEDEDD
jgi:hypothetical protein